MGFDQRPPTSGGLDPNSSPNLPIADSSQGHDIPTGVAPSLAKLQDWTAWLRANGVFYDDPVGDPGVITGDMTIGGDLTVADDVTIASELSVGVNATIGADLTVGDDLFVTDDATIGDNLTVSGNASVAGTLTVSTSATVNGTITAGSSGNFVLSPARSWTRRCMRICSVDSAGMPGSPVAWVEGLSVNSPPRVRFLEGVAGSFHFLELEDLPHGGTMTQVEIVTAGLFSTAAIGAAAQYQIIRWQGSGALQTMSTNDSDTHTSGTWNDDITHTITVTSNSQIDRAYRYALKVFHHQTVDAGADMVIKDLVITGTVSSLQV